MTYIPVDYVWLIWLVIGVVLIFLEMLLPGFILCFFGMGAILAGASAFLGFSLTIQVAIFVVSSLVLLIFLRRTLSSVFKGQSLPPENLDDTPQNSVAEVSEPITPSRPGRISFRGSFWDAESDQTIDVGETVRIIRQKDNNKNTFIVTKEN